MNTDQSYERTDVCIVGCGPAGAMLGLLLARAGVQVAVATANLLGDGLRRGSVTGEQLAAVQRRRAWPAALTQRIQLLIQHQLISGRGDPDGTVHTPRLMRVLSKARPLRQLFSRFMAIGVRNEHVASLPPGVRTVAVPATGLLAGALPRVDWSDAYEVEIRPGAPTDPQVWSDAIFHNAPGWVRKLIAVRQATVGLVGIDRGRPDTFDARTRTDDEVLLGTDERHLSFRASVLVQDGRVVLSTAVQVHSRRGRAYSALVRLAHPAVARAVLARAAETLSATPQGALR